MTGPLDDAQVAEILAAHRLRRPHRGGVGCMGCEWIQTRFDHETTHEAHRAHLAAVLTQRIEADRAALAARLAEGPKQRLCSQCGEQMSVMVKVGTQDGWCSACLDEAAEGPAVTRLAEVMRDYTDLVSRLGFGDNRTEPMADNDTIVAWFEQQSRDANEWQESQRWRDECYAAGHPEDQDCYEHDPARRLEQAEARLAEVEGEVERLRAEAADTIGGRRVAALHKSYGVQIQAAFDAEAEADRRAEQAEAERDDARAAVERVEALADGVCDCESMGGRFGSHRNECPTARIRAALRGEAGEGRE
jgi:hypothetical protein